MKIKTSVDTRNMASFARRLRQSMPQAINHGLEVTGLAIVGDAVNIPPKPRIRTGMLRGSWAVVTKGKVAAKGPHTGGGEAKDIVTGEQSTGSYWSDVTPDGVGDREALVGFNTPYAAKMHEKPKGEYKAGPFSSKKTQDTMRRRARWNKDAGPKFLQSKIERYRARYARVFREAFLQKLQEVVR